MSLVSLSELETKDPTGETAGTATVAVEGSPFPFFAVRATRSCSRLRFRPFPKVTTCFFLPSGMVSYRELLL